MLEDKIKKIRAIERVLNKKKDYDKILYYNSGQKIHKKQLEFAKCQKRNRWIFGGNRSGKTECGAVEAVWMARGIHPYRTNRPNCSGWVVSLSKAMSRDIAQNKILEYLNPNWIDSIVMLSGSSDNPKNGIIDFITIKNVFGGVSRIGFKSCEMGRDKFQGTSLDFVWFDEEPPKDIYEECRMRVLDKVGDIWGTMTPLLGLTWVYNQIYLNEGNDQDIWCMSMEWADNPYLSTKEIESLTASLSEDQLESRRYGKFRTTSGLVYTEFDERVHCIEPFCVPHEWYNNISIDPGLQNPLSAHFYAVDFDGVVYVVAEHYQAKQDIITHANQIKSIANKLNWHYRNGYLDALIDSAATQHTLASTKSVAELFYQQGICVNTKVNKDLYSGINTVKRYLKGVDGRPQIYIFKNCVNLIRELKSYWWGNGDVPKKIDDHALDELRYFLMSLPRRVETVNNTQTLVQMHKQRLVKKTKK